VARGRGHGELHDFTLGVNEGRGVLDIIHRLQATQASDLAVRWTCNAGTCGSCSAEVNGKSRPMCMTRMLIFAEDKVVGRTDGRPGKLPPQSSTTGPMQNGQLHTPTTVSSAPGQPRSGVGLIEGWPGTIAHRVELDPDGTSTGRRSSTPVSSTGPPCLSRWPTRSCRASR